jgi:hypothetical protein
MLALRIPDEIDGERPLNYEVITIDILMQIALSYSL